MTYQHFILIHNGYKEGRIGFHRCYEDISGFKDFMKYKKILKEKFDNMNFAFHQLPTSKKTLDSVKEYDSYFEGIREIKDFEKFYKTVEEDLLVDVYDIAKIILSKKAYTQLELQKIIFLVYVEYLKKYNEKLFKEEFDAWTYGPVIEKLYKSSKKYNSQKITKYFKNDETKMQILSRSQKIKGYDKIIEVIDETIRKHRNVKNGEFIDLTHTKDGAWEKTFRRVSVRKGKRFSNYPRNDIKIPFKHIRNDAFNNRYCIE
jgi:uncharacterized phage-associated protein